MNNDPRGTLIQQGNIMLIENAYVEEVVCFDSSSGYMIVSYAVPEQNNTTSIQNIRLNLDSRTQVLDPFGQTACLCCLQSGTWVNAIFSANMTRSNPPQANAFLIVVQRNPAQPSPPTTPGRPPQMPQPQPPQRPQPQPPQRPQPQPPEQPASVTTGRIVLVDFGNNYFITENLRNSNNQIRFNVNQNTTYTNRQGMPIQFRDLQPGQMVRVTHANFQTASIPPQTTAFRVELM